MTGLVMDPRAASAFNARAESLCQFVTPSRIQQRSDVWKPDVHTKLGLSETDFIGEPDVGMKDPDGVYVAMTFHHAGSNFELAGDGYLELRKLVEMIAKTSSFKESVSAKTIEQKLRHWVRGRFRAQSAGTFVEYLTIECNALITACAVWIPIQRLHIQRTLHLGAARLETITKEQCDALIARKPVEVREHAERRTRPFQGHAALVLDCVAEPERAIELAVEQADLILAVLSPFSLGTLRSRTGSTVQPWGVQHPGGLTALVYRDGQFSSMTQRIPEGDPPPLVIDEQLLQVLSEDIARADWLLKNAKEGSLSALVIDALRIYRRATLSRDPAEKLIFVFAALESFFSLEATSQFKTVSALDLRSL